MLKQGYLLYYPSLTAVPQQYFFALNEEGKLNYYESVDGPFLGCVNLSGCKNRVVILTNTGDHSDQLFRVEITQILDCDGLSYEVGQSFKLIFGAASEESRATWCDLLLNWRRNFFSAEDAELDEDECRREYTKLRSILKGIECSNDPAMDRPKVHRKASAAVQEPVVKKAVSTGKLSSAAAKNVTMDKSLPSSMYTFLKTGSKTFSKKNPFSFTNIVEKSFQTNAGTSSIMV